MPSIMEAMGSAEADHSDSREQNGGVNGNTDQIQQPQQYIEIDRATEEREAQQVNADEMEHVNVSSTTTTHREFTQNDKINKRLLESLLHRMKMDFGEVDSTTTADSSNSDDQQQQQQQQQQNGDDKMLCAMLQKCRDTWNSDDDPEDSVSSSNDEWR